MKRNNSILLYEEIKKLKSFKKIYEKSNDIDCSRLFITKFFKKKFGIVLNYFNSFACYNKRYNAIFLNSNSIRKTNINRYISFIPPALSHESLHMILVHLFDEKTSIGLDELLKKKGRYDIIFLDNSGL